MTCKSSLWKFHLLPVILLSCWMFVSCNKDFEKLSAARYNQYIYDDEGAYLSFWNDTIGLYLQPWNIEPEVYTTSVRKSRQMRKIGPSFGGKKLVETFRYSSIDSSTQQSNSRFLKLVQYATKIPDRTRATNPITYYKGLKIYQTSRKSYSFSDRNDNHFGVIIDQDLISKGDSFALTGILNGLTTNSADFALEFDNWYERADAKVLDTTEGYQTYLRLLFYLSQNYHWAAGTHDMANEMYTTKICDVASRLHKFGFIREYLRKFGWLDFDLHKKGEELQVRQLRQLIQETLTKYVSNSIVEPVLDSIGQQKVVMINENHFDWRHRYFTELLLEGLKKRGFDLIGFETLGYDDSLNQRRFANYYSGYYSRESQMSNLIRTSAKQGFELFSYEDTIFDRETSFVDSIYINSRELMQAINVANILATHPNRKVVIHAGYGHINEAGALFGKKIALAEILKRNYGINPYTINQTFLGDLAVPLSVTTTANKNFYIIDKSKLLYVDSMRFGQNDLYLYNSINFNPNEDVIWDDHTKIKTELRKTFLDSILLKTGLQSTLELYTQEEFSTLLTIPYYVKHVIPPGTSQPAFLSYDDCSIPNHLYLPQGSYVVVLRTHTGEVVYKDFIQVEKDEKGK